MVVWYENPDDAAATMDALFSSELFSVFHQIRSELSMGSRAAAVQQFPATYDAPRRPFPSFNSDLIAFTFTGGAHSVPIKGNGSTGYGLSVTNHVPSLVQRTRSNGKGLNGSQNGVSHGPNAAVMLNQNGPINNSNGPALVRGGDFGVLRFELAGRVSIIGGIQDHSFGEEYEEKAEREAVCTQGSGLRRL
nr:hypothetical protein Iba_chr05dCG15030 [Ipomoea batatas]